MVHHDDDETRQKQRRTLSVQAAVDQNFEYFGLFSGERLNLGDGGPELEIPHPEYLLPEQQKRLGELRVKFDGYTLTSSGEYVDGDGDLVWPPYDEQLCVALWGEDDYKRFVAAGGRPGLVGVVWARMRTQFAKASRIDSKSG